MIISLGIIFEANSLSGDVLVACGNTSLNTQRLEPEHCLGDALGQEEERGNEPVQDAEDVQSVKRISEFIESILQEPMFTREAPNSRHQTFLE